MKLDGVDLQPMCGTFVINDGKSSLLLIANPHLSKKFMRIKNLKGWNGWETLAVGRKSLINGEWIEVDPTMDDTRFAKKLFWKKKELVLLHGGPVQPGEQCIMARHPRFAELEQHNLDMDDPDTPKLLDRFVERLAIEEGAARVWGKKKKKK